MAHAEVQDAPLKKRITKAFDLAREVGEWGHREVGEWGQISTFDICL
jgi:hypothetical protein